MRNISLIAALLSLLLPAAGAYGFSEKEQDCAKCHTLSKEEAAALLKDLIPNAKVLDVLVSPVKGVWEIDLEAGGKKGPLYIDFSKKHVLSGAIVSIKERRNLTQERADDLNRVDLAQIPLDDALIIGDKDAKYRVIVFDDPD